MLQDDPQCPSNKTNTLPQPECRIAAGQKQIGYAAAQSLGYTSAHGELNRWDIAYIVREYLEYMGNALLAIGLPHNKLYHHAGGVPNIPYNSSFTSAVKNGAGAGWSVGGPWWPSTKFDPAGGWCEVSKAQAPWACDQNRSVRAFFGPTQKMRWAAVEWGGWTAHTGGGLPCCNAACNSDDCHTQATIEMAYTTAFQYEDCRIVAPYAWESVYGNKEAQNAVRHFILNWKEPAGSVCDAALEAACPQQSGKLSAHRVLLCDECAGKKQAQLQIAGCTAEEVQKWCTAAAALATGVA